VGIVLHMMKIESAPSKRRPGWPWWAMLLLVLWMALGSADLLLRASTGRPAQLCLLKRLTGCPCPTCGFTRGTLALLQGHPVQGWLYNPLLFSTLGLLGVVLAVRLLLGRSLQVHLTRRERIVAWLMAVLLLIANWLYVIRYVG
jgi:hypothetical protein